MLILTLEEELHLAIIYGLKGEKLSFEVKKLLFLKCTV